MASNLTGESLNAISVAVSFAIIGDAELARVQRPNLGRIAGVADEFFDDLSFRALVTSLPVPHGSVSRHFDFSNLCNHVRKTLVIWKNVVASDGMRFGLANYAGSGMLDSG